MVWVFIMYTFLTRNTITSDTSELDIVIASGYDEIVFEFNQYRGGASHGNGFGWQVNTASDSGWDRPMCTSNYGINSGYGYNWQSDSFYNSHETHIGFQMPTDQALQGITMAGENETGDADISSMSSSGMLTLYKPKEASLGYDKHFISSGAANYKSGSAWYTYSHSMAGYIKETEALTAIRFEPFVGNFDRIIVNQYGLA